MHDLNAYKNGGLYQKPEWNPKVLHDDHRHSHVDQLILNHYSEYPIYRGVNVISTEQCESLIHQFDEQIQTPVGVDGYGNPADNIGSYRAMAWGMDLAQHMTKILSRIVTRQTFIRSTIGGMDTLQVPHMYYSHDRKECYRPLFATPFKPEKHYIFLGSTPWMRFMKYADGGMHTPHYDAPFLNEEGRYTTLFSWVLYLNTPSGKGGRFQFVKDHQHHLHPMHQDRSDWKNMSDEVLMHIKPEQGTLLVFPHWLCHQVEKYTGEEHRYIIRGDVAYGF